VTWGPGEEPLVRALAGGMRTAPRVPLATTIVPEMVALLRRGGLVVGGDQGPIHVAAALVVPALGLYGPTSARRNGPYGGRVATIRSPAGGMDDTPVGAALEAATGLGPVTGTSTLSVAGITRNEEESLGACLERVGWADEIVVVDAGSTDKTVAVAREFTDRVLFRPWTGSGAQKNFALDQGTGSWILFLDADQRVPEPLRDNLRAVTRLDPPEAGFAMARWHVRLFQQGRGRFSARAVHESGSLDGPVGLLGEALVRESYQGVADFGTRTSRYSGLAAGELAAAGHGGGVGDLTVRPRWRFARMSLLQGGFLDGWRGFVLAMLYAPYVVVRAAKVRELRAACPAGPGVAG